MKSQKFDKIFFIHNRTKKPMTAGQNVNILKRNTNFSNQKNTKPLSMLSFQSFKKEWAKLAHPRCKPEPVKPTGDVKQRKQRR